MTEAAGFLIAAAAFAVLRSAAITHLNTEWFPWGTLSVNAVGSFAAGVIVAVAPPAWSTVAGIAALGSFTTFSTFAVEVVSMWSRHRRAAVAYGAATTVSAIGAAAVGLGF